MPMATAQLLLPSRTKGTLKIPKADKEGAAMVRCYEVYIGDRVEIDTHDEGTVQGVTTHMLWRGEMGFRQLDTLEVQWHSATGELQMGEIEMWERWRRVGNRQRGKGEAPELEPKAPADVPTMNNKAEATHREGGAGVHIVRGDRDGMEGGTAAVLQDSAGLREARKRSARTLVSDDEAAGARGRGRACVHTYVHMGGHQHALNSAAAGMGRSTGPGAEGGDLGTERVSPEIELPNNCFF